MAAEIQEEISERLNPTHLYGDTYREGRGIDWGPLGFPTATIQTEVRRDRDLAERDLLSTTKRLRQRLVTLDAFIRNAAVANSTRASTRVAARVMHLTWIMLGLAMLCLITSLMPDEAKIRILGAARSQSPTVASSPPPSKRPRVGP
jgi:hypothetical protein